MLKYAKVLNKISGLCEVAIGTNETYYKSIGMKLLDVQQSDIDSQWYLTDQCPMKSDEEKVQEERNRLDLLSLTKREVFLALYKDKGITPEQLRSQITDTEALIEFDYAESYFRGNPLIDKIGIMLGYSTEDLDHLFETGILPEKVEEPEENYSGDASDDEKPIGGDDTPVVPTEETEEEEE